MYIRIISKKEVILMTNCHPKFEIPTDPHGKRRYESAMKHVEAAKKACLLYTSDAADD